VARAKEPKLVCIDLHDFRRLRQTAGPGPHGTPACSPA
jgi:hypothetical protein